MMTLKIAFRNILRQKRRTILTALAMIAGFTLSSVFIGWSDGAYSDIIAMFTRNRIGHIQVHLQGYLDKPSLYKTIDNYESIGETIGSVKGVEAWAPRVYAAGLGSVGEKSTAVQIIGIDVAREVVATRFNQKIIAGRGFSMASMHVEREAILGRGLARILSATVDSEIVLVSQGADGSIANDLYTIVGIAESGDETTDRMACYLHIRDAQELLVLAGRVHEIVVIVSNINHVGKIARATESRLDDAALDVAPWQEVAKSFYRAMQADKQGDLIGRIVIMLIVAIGVLNTVLMSVLERTREYGVLKAIGTKPVQIFSLVICEVVIIALGSIVVGALLGILINHLLSIYGITLPQEFTYGGIKFQTMYAEVNARSLIVPGVTVLLSATLVSLFPALKAARIMPAKAMRTH
ncbi:MAG: ABC transporter permease [Candidatus Poribacteria bacterium]|nr:ABC transporter permease [Candidatus Poribacteria bacterium]